MTFNWKKFLRHFFVLIGFIAVSLIYFYPVLQGKVIYQSDIAQYQGMAKQQKDFIANENEQPYWTDAAFGGMPTYQLGANYPYNYIKEIDRSLRFLPRPADYLFLYFIGFYILLCCLKIDYRLAAVGALAFGFSTYLIVILGVGHNAKAHAIAYMPLVLAGIITTFRKKYITGGLLLTFAMALEVNANHPQMTYYLLLLVIVLGIAYFIDYFRKKQLKTFFTALGVMVITVVIAVGTNATGLLATKEYSEFSTRGQTGLTINKDGSVKKEQGLDYDYITEYSYGWLESFNLFIPRFMGGASTETLDSDSETYKALRQIGASPAQADNFIKNAPTYWGDQTFVGAPAYIGAGVIFLAVLALFLVRGRKKWWLVGGSVLALLLSFGDNFSVLTKFFIDNVPLYNKFRAVSSIQVIIELCLPILAIIGLSKIYKPDVENSEKLEALKWSTVITGGLALLFLLLKSMLFDFSSTSDRMYIEQLGPDFVSALKADRAAIFTEDTIRSLIIVLVAAGFIWFYLKGKLSKGVSIVALGLLLMVDLINVDKRYVNNEDFVSKKAMEQPFQATGADKEILQDKGHFRVLDLSGSPLNSARASFFHNSVGGYHAAKPGKMQELFDFHIYEGNQEVLNMLNTKYTIISNQGQTMAQLNPNANGNAWFVNKVVPVKNANQEILSLDTLQTKQTAVVNEKFLEYISKQNFNPSPKDSITLQSYQPNELVYTYNIDSPQLAIFSEIYYPHGWKAFVDGKPIEHFRADYVLRAAVLPAGTHELVFKFDPEVVKTGSTITIISGVVLLLVLIGGIWFLYKENKPS
ncbi:YfhO family protein [Haloflavibacter putidus]|uniref:YfhO family protein n=1 Tax=Haloflavibacter putidus TaxID=2576776 RepID=A0A507ZS01_9FLAO|nr:YfhO family protein [Haloflavibacter putidus]TQD40149.1 YfhO family protein [Haloflavibacter putidus]